jgi:hypothetical protein
MAQWLTTCGRVDVAFALSSLSRFSSCPRKDHLVAATRMFKYLKKNPEKWIIIDPKPHKVPGELTLAAPDQANWDQQYPGCELGIELDPKHPKPMGKPIDTTVYFDSNFAHDEKTRRSISGNISFVAGTPVSWISKRQGAIATSTYSAEMCAAKLGAEEAISIRYMLRSFGVRLAGPTLLIGDNLGMLHSVASPGTLCKKKLSQVAYHYVQECNAMKEVLVRKIHTSFNISDALTKALDKSPFWSLFKHVFKT